MLITSKKKFKVLAFLLAAFFLLLFGGMEFLHHHSYINDDEKCQVCALSNTLANTLVKFESILQNNNTFEFLHFDYQLPFIELKVQYLNNSRAPPVLI